MKKIAYILVGTLAGTQAHAVVDTTAIQTELDAMVGYMTVVGGALIAAAAAAIGFKWIKGALFS